MLKKFSKNKALIIAVILLIGLLFRLWHIDFGLPHYFHNDEAEIVELALTPAIEFKNTFFEGNLNRLKPGNFVYGTFPSYALIPDLLVLNQINQLFDLNLVKSDFYLQARIDTAALSLGIILATGLLYKTIFKDKKGFYLALLFAALNWKLIVFGHFVNVDIFLTLTLSVMYLFLVKFFETGRTKPLIIAGIAFGLAAGTKITALITFPLIFLALIFKKEYREFLIFAVVSFFSFAITNPFSLIYFDEFFQRILKLRTKEAGAVFSSANENPLRYLFSLAYISTPIVFLISIYGKIKAVLKPNRTHLFLIGNVILYIAFFSISNRRVDRWMLPLIPIIIVYASYGLTLLLANLNKYLKWVVLVLVFASYLYFPILLLFQFKSDTPKSLSYKWSKRNLPEQSTKLVITETGNSPYKNIENTEIYKFNVYESEGAQFEIPPNVKNTDYIILASKPMESFKRRYVVKHFPEYSNQWIQFENKIKNSGDFELIKIFTLPKPNIITLSDMYIYKNLNKGL